MTTSIFSHEERKALDNASLTGGIHLSMSTVLPATAKKLAALHAQHDSIYVEAPIFGRREAAVAHQLWIPFAGPKPAKERVRPLLSAMGAQGIDSDQNRRRSVQASRLHLSAKRADEMEVRWFLVV